MIMVTKSMAREIAEIWLDGNEIPTTEEIREASMEVYEFYWNDTRFADVKSELENKIAQECALRERQGFIVGFERAVELLSKGGI